MSYNILNAHPVTELGVLAHNDSERIKTAYTHKGESTVKQVTSTFFEPISTSM